MYFLPKLLASLTLLTTLASTSAIPAAPTSKKPGFLSQLDLPIGACVPQILTLSHTPNKLQSFIVAPDGLVYGQHWETGSSPFTDWYLIPGVSLPPCSPITGTTRGDGWIDIFVTADDGKVYTNFRSELGGWSGWKWIEGGFAKAGSPVGVVSKALGQLDIFVVGTDDSVWSAAWENGRDALGNYRGWWKIGQGVLNGAVPAAAPIEVVSRRDGLMDAFVAAKNSRMYWASYSDGSWGAWTLLTGVAFPGTPLTCVSRTSDTLDLWFVATDNNIYFSSYTVTTGWAAWRRLLNTVALARSSPIGAVVKSPDELFYTFVANDQNVYSGSWSVKTNWVNPTILNKGKAYTGTKVMAVSRKRGVIDVFTFALDAWSWGVHWEQGNEGWCGWWQTTFKGPACFSSSSSGKA